MDKVVRSATVPRVRIHKYTYACFAESLDEYQREIRLRFTREDSPPITVEWSYWPHHKVISVHQAGSSVDLVWWIGFLKGFLYTIDWFRT